MNLCSNCSVPVKPIVAVDIDGTIAEYHNHLRLHVERYFGIQCPRGYWNGEGNYEDWLGISHDQYREAKLAFRQGGLKRWAPVMPDVEVLLEILSEWRQEGKVEVWITTTRPWNRLDSTDPDTRFWLDQHFRVYDHLLYDENKYEELGRIVQPMRVLAVVDDLPEKIAEAQQVFGSQVPMMVRRPHNVTWTGRERRLPLYDIATEIERRLQLWHNHTIIVNSEHG